MKYRSEIDGLRALAVIPVVFFHAGVDGISGGFIGVDIFFVISGYLITTIILSEKDKGVFTLVNFYERRARRILPVLFFVMLVSLIFAWIWLLPKDMVGFSKSLIAVPTFVSNILFWKETGYWGEANELKPLLHTWSLAVEEQYYILFPLFLMIMWRFQRRWIFVSFAIAAVVSLFLSQWGTYYHPEAAFFLLPTRGWELAIGACIAFHFLYKKEGKNLIPGQKNINEILSVFGLVMIVYAIFYFDESTPFPGLYALIPTVGTGLIIVFSSSNTVVGRLLGSPLPVGIGLISYSAYLWHQPLLAFTRYSVSAKPSSLLMISMAALSFPLAYLSWRFVEKPFRKKERFSRAEIFTYSIIGSLVFIAIGAGGVLTEGYSLRSEHSQYINEKLRVNYGLSDQCDDHFTLSPKCQTNKNPEIVVWGDSFAMHIVEGIIASNPDAKIIQMTKSNCGPHFDVAPFDGVKHLVTSASECLEFTGKVREWLSSNNTVKYAVLSSPFRRYTSQHSKLLDRNNEVVDSTSLLLEKSFENTLKQLVEMGIKPVIFSPPPRSEINLGLCLAKQYWADSGLEKCDYRMDEIPDFRLRVYEFLAQFDDRYSVNYLNKMICEGMICRTNMDSIFLYRDSAHLSYEGAAALGGKYDFYNLVTAD